MTTPNKGGRPAGRLIHAEAFEALLAARNLLKKDVAADVGVSPGYLADLLAHRCGASVTVADQLASALGVKLEAIFPEAAGWIGPLPDRDGRRTPAGVA